MKCQAQSNANHILFISYRLVVRAHSRTDQVAFYRRIAKRSLTTLMTRFNVAADMFCSEFSNHILLAQLTGIDFKGKQNASRWTDYIYTVLKIGHAMAK